MPVLGRAALVCFASSSLLPLWAQSPPKIDPSSQPAVNQLIAVARAIKECPRELTSERKQRKEKERRYLGPPQNVVWDVMLSTSQRSPYTGSIEFSLTGTEWDSSSNSIHTSLFGSPIRHRYEFDLGPRGLELARMLHYGGPELRTELFDESSDETCWQNAARSVQGMSNPSAATQIAADVGATSIISLLGSAFLLRCDTEDVIRKESCKLWLTGVHSGLAAAGVMVDAVQKEAAKNKVVVCLPKSGLSDEQFLGLVLKYIKDHPSDQDQPTAALALDALQEPFLCK